MQRLEQKQFLPISLDEAWDFFATPKNLDQITPHDMVFEITSTLPDKMYEGLMITYRIRPFLSIPFNWCTEITHIREKKFFVDEQRKGPYNIWHHEHHFYETAGGVMMTDILHYDIGKSLIGWIAGKLYIHKRVKDIFNHRYAVLERKFGVEPRSH